MEFVVRRATVDDGMAIGAMHVAAWREAYPHLLSEASLARLSEGSRGRRWVQILEGESSDTFVAIDDTGAIVGHSSAGQADAGAPRDRELFSIYILAAVYGTGLGQRLLDAVVGDKPACLWVAADNPRAQAFYRRNGFEVVGEPVRHPLILDEIDELRMAR